MGRKARSEPGEQVANRIPQVREAAGISRQEFANSIGVHYQTVGYLERGEYSPSLVLALRIAAVLGCSVEDIFSLDTSHANNRPDQNQPEQNQHVEP